ncbi:unnamed protein product [Rotaria socialis]|uniref:ABC transporter domain-containing protein n=2 Tax=Rotaria socialis TaxID=392032 RepID=A0A820P0G1_9BILA|nr:unnamed protein product [Rotaria socialis]CAF4394280.1 unnamed protein product [Rotaria socialis]CAF4488936.1 unnamed protein product [Rotaria socialis]
MSETNEHSRLILPSELSSSTSTTEVTLSWSNLYVETRDSGSSCWSSISSSCFRRHKKKQEKSRIILQDVTGNARTGQILAIMGTSGVGKTTLMNALSGHLGDNLVVPSGNVYLNGFPTTDTERRKSGHIGYAEQQEFFIDTMSLEEHLIFQAMLRLPSELTDDERRSRVKNTIAQLHLNKCMKNTINQLSGGEKKRLALASVFLTEPSVLLIDEPTSGLDSYLAMHIMRTIHSMAFEQRKTVIVVIHQPTSSMFDLCDIIFLLVKGGRQAFYGTKDEALEFFIKQCHLSPSSIDGFIEQLAAPPNRNVDEDTNIQTQVADQYASSEQAVALKETIEHQLTLGNNTILTDRMKLFKNPTFGRQVKWLLWRSFVSDTRNSVRTTFVLFRTVVLTCIFGIVYFQLCRSGHFMQNVNAVSFTVVALTVNASAYVILSTMPINNKIGIRENHRGMFSILAYYVSVVVHDFPMLITFPLLVNTIIYWMSGMDNTWSHYLSFIAVGILVSNTASAYGQFFASFSSTIEGAISASVPILQTFTILSGFFLSLTHIPTALRVLQYISPHYYAYTTFMILEWKTGSITHQLNCSRSENYLESINQVSSYNYSRAEFCSRILRHSGDNIDGRYLAFNILMLALLFKRRKKPTINDDDNRKPYRLGRHPGEQGPRLLSSNQDRIENLATGKTGTTAGQAITNKTTAVVTSNAKIGQRHWKITKDTLTVGTWNVQTLWATGKLELLRNEMKRFRFDVIGAYEVRWTGKGETLSGDFIWPGEDTTHTRGVGML